MKHQQVNVDFWSMGKAMLMYLFMTAMGWIILRLFNTVFSMPRRMRTQQENLQNTLQELQRRFPDMNITEDDLKNAEKELEEIIKESSEKKDTPEEKGETSDEPKAIEECKKDI